MIDELCSLYFYLAWISLVRSVPGLTLYYTLLVVPFDTLNCDMPHANKCRLIS